MNTKQNMKSIFSNCQITKHIMLPITSIGKNIREILENIISKMISGTCIVEGYVRPNSIKVITYSSGIVQGTQVVFDVVFNCDVCFIVAGMLLNCIVKDITKAGIRAESFDESPTPFVLFVARDHYYLSNVFNNVKANDKIIARVIAQRFELNDKYISVIAEIAPNKTNII